MTKKLGSKNKSRSTTVTATMRIDNEMNLVLLYLADVSNGTESRNSLVNTALAEKYNLSELLPKATSHFAQQNALAHAYSEPTPHTGQISI